MKDRIEYFFLFATAKVLQALPLGMVRRLAKLTAGIVYHCIPIRRALTLEQLRIAFPAMPPAMIRRHAREAYTGITTTIFELLWTPRLNERTARRVVTWENPELLQRLVAEKRGIVFVTGHLGNWEWLAICMQMREHMKITAVYHPPHNQGVNTLIGRYRTLSGVEIVTMSEAPRRLLRVLASGGAAFLVADQSAPRESVFINFFNRPAATFQGPAAFALKTGAELVGAWSIRMPDGNYRAKFEIIPRDGLPESPDDAVRELTRRQVKSLERIITRHPGQWLWQHRRWKNVPASADDIWPDPD